MAGFATTQPIPEENQLGAGMVFGPVQIWDGVPHQLAVNQSNSFNINGAGKFSASGPPPQFQYTFDTIGQTIFRSIGHNRLPLRIIWAQGINASGDTSVSSTQTFAAAICAPIDPLEEGEITAIWDGGSQIFNSSGAVSPDGWSAEDLALLNASLASVVIYPGDEAQLPASLIVADKGADKTNAFRGIRYLIFQDYPINGGGGSGVPQISIGWTRSNDGDKPKEEGSLAFEFPPGTS